MYRRGFPNVCINVAALFCKVTCKGGRGSKCHKKGSSGVWFIVLVKVARSSSFHSCGKMELEKLSYINFAKNSPR